MAAPAVAVAAAAAAAAAATKSNHQHMPACYSPCQTRPCCRRSPWRLRADALLLPLAWCPVDHLRQSAVVQLKLLPLTHAFQHGLGAQKTPAQTRSARTDRYKRRRLMPKIEAIETQHRNECLQDRVAAHGQHWCGLTSIVMPAHPCASGFCPCTTFHMRCKILGVLVPPHRALEAPLHQCQCQDSGLVPGYTQLWHSTVCCNSSLRAAGSSRSL